MGALNSPFVSHREELLQTRLIAGDLKGRDSIPTARVGEIKRGVCGVGDKVLSVRGLVSEYNSSPVCIH